jgi:hypothetical protein
VKSTNLDSVKLSRIREQSTIKEENEDMDMVSVVSEIDSKFENSMLSFMDVKNRELQDEIEKNN